MDPRGSGCSLQLWREHHQATTIQEWSGGKVTIAREDTPNSLFAGLTVVYSGSLCGKSIRGTALAHYPGHGDKDFTVPWIATVPETSCDAVGDDEVRLIEVAQTATRFRQKPSRIQMFNARRGIRRRKCPYGDGADVSRWYWDED